MEVREMWVYAGSFLAGALWGGGYVKPEVSIAFMAGIWIGSPNSDVVKWAVVAFIAGVVVGGVVLKKRET